MSCDGVLGLRVPEEGTLIVSTEDQMVVLVAKCDQTMVTNTNTTGPGGRIGGPGLNLK